MKSWVVRVLFVLPMVAAFLSLSTQPQASAQTPAFATIEGIRIPVVASGREEYARVGVQAGARAAGAFAAAPTATFVVKYTGFTPEAQAAFQAAVDVWATTIVSSVPITIDATWTNLRWPVLGQGGPNLLTFGTNPPPGALPNTYYPFALANALAGSDLYPSTSDLSVTFTNDSRANWYLGTDGNVPSGKTDFESVVLQEIGHGLGFIASFGYSGGTGSFGWGSPARSSPFDTFVVNGNNAKLTTYANPSTALGGQLVSNNVYWNGSNAMAANNGSRPRLYAPTTWSNGSSIAHLDEATYGPSSGNALMTPAIGTAEAEHSPGPIVRGIFKDMGWQLADGSAAENPAPVLTSLSTASRTAGGGSFTLTLNGSGFLNTSVVNVNGSDRTTTFVSASQLKVTVTAADQLSVGDVPIFVTNPAPGGGQSATLQLKVVATPVALASYLSLGSGTTLGGLSIANEDIVRYNGSGGWTMLFDGSDVGLSATGIDAFQVLANGQILLSFTSSLTLGTLGTVDAADIVRFTPTSTGTTTAGSFAMFFDASDVGLSGSFENTDAFFYDSATARLYLSTAGSFSVTGLSGANRDIFVCKGFQSGNSTRCNSGFSIYFDGDDIGLTLSSENVDAFSIGPDGTLYFSTTGSYSLTVGGLSGSAGDVFACANPITGSSSSCGAVSKVVSASAAGLGSLNVTGFGLAP